MQIKRKVTEEGNEIGKIRKITESKSENGTKTLSCVFQIILANLYPGATVDGYVSSCSSSLKVHHVFTSFCLEKISEWKLLLFKK